MTTLFKNGKQPAYIPFKMHEFERALVDAGYSQRDAIKVISGMKEAFRLLEAKLPSDDTGPRITLW